MLVGDVMVLVFALVATVSWVVIRRREKAEGLEVVKLESLWGLVIGGIPFAALSVAMFAFAVVCFASPMEVDRVKRFGDVHNWATGIVAIFVGLFIAMIPLLLWGKARSVWQSSRGQRPGRRPPPRPDVTGALVADLASADDAGDLARVARRYLQESHGAPGTASTTAELQSYLEDSAMSREDVASWSALLEDLDASRFAGAAADLDDLVGRLGALVVIAETA